MSGAEAPCARLKDPREPSRRAAARLEGASSACAAGSGVLRGHSRTARTPRRSLPRRLPYALACALSLSPIVALCGGGRSGAGPESAETVIPLARAQRTESPLPRATHAHGEGGGEALRTPAGRGGRGWKWPRWGNDRWLGERRRGAARHVTAPRAPGAESVGRGRAQPAGAAGARPSWAWGSDRVRARPPACPLRRPVLLTRALSRAEMPSATNGTMASSSGKAGPGGNEQAPAAAAAAPQASGGSITSVQTEAMKQILGVIDKKLRNLEKKKVLPYLLSPLPTLLPPGEVAGPSDSPLGPGQLSCGGSPYPAVSGDAGPAQRCPFPRPGRVSVPSPGRRAAAARVVPGVAPRGRPLEGSRRASRALQAFPLPLSGVPWPPPQAAPSADPARPRGADAALPRETAAEGGGRGVSLRCGPRAPSRRAPSGAAPSPFRLLFAAAGLSPVELQEGRRSRPSCGPAPRRQRFPCPLRRAEPRGRRAASPRAAHMEAGANMAAARPPKPPRRNCIVPAARTKPGRPSRRSSLRSALAPRESRVS